MKGLHHHESYFKVQQFSDRTVFRQGCCQNGSFYKYVLPRREYFHISLENRSLVSHSWCLVGKHIYLTNIAN